MTSRSTLTPPQPAARMWARSRDGVRLNVEVHGPSGAGVPTVVLIHGWTCSIPFWAPVIRELREELRVIVYDQRGHGASDTPRPGDYGTEALADDLTAVLDTALPAGEKAVLAGHSMGGMTIMASARRDNVRARVRGALLASTGCAALATEALVVPLRRMPRLAAAAHRWLLTSATPLGRVTPLSRAALRYATLGPGATRELATGSAAIIQSCDRRVRAAWGRVLATLDLGEAIPLLDVPTHVLVGTADRLTPPVHARRIAERLPRCEGLIELPGRGHMTPLEAPDTVAGLIRKLAAAGTA